MTALRLANLLLLQAAFLSDISIVHGDEAEANEDEGNEDAKSKASCGVYLAPSSIPGAGLGMYAGDQPYEKGDTVTLGDVIIPIIEQEWNTERLGVGDFLWDEYTWNGIVFDGAEEEVDDLDLIMFASPGVGAAANSYLTLANVDDTYITLSRGVSADSPGVGAISPYHERSFFATRKIPAGGEIFADYGPHYFKTRTHTYGYLPLPKSFKVADLIIKGFLAKRVKLKSKEELANNRAFWADFWDLIKGHGTIWQTSRILNALPENHTSLTRDFFAKGGSSQQHFQRSIRDISWLEEHGQCMDNIKVGQSDNPDAGRGAFANRFIAEGGLVAPAPLIHVASWDYLKMFTPIDDWNRNGRVVPDIDGPMSYQLLMNYCFGHDESTLLFCPYGLLTSFINHSHENPNTRIVWSKEMRHPEWREQNSTLWLDEYHTGVSIDFVALRDIQEDEEILINYGESWEQAWQEHVQHFVPRPNYTPAYELNEMENTIYRTVDDRPYELDSVQLHCRVWYVRRFLKSATDDTPCQILKKLDEDRYLVQLLTSLNNDDDGVTEFSTGKMLWDVPSDAFYFWDLPYTRDHHMFNTFRHPMMLPDDIFPEMWKNKEEV